MKVSELIKKLKKAGCKLERYGSLHDIWYSPITNKIFMVPRHKSQELPKGTERNILKDAGLE